MAVKYKTIGLKTQKHQHLFHLLENVNFLLTVDLCDTSTTLHSDSDVNSSKALLPQQQHGLQELPEHTDFTP